jgi:hypothetical protein
MKLSHAKLSHCTLTRGRTLRLYTLFFVHSPSFRTRNQKLSVLRRHHPLCIIIAFIVFHFKCCGTNSFMLLNNSMEVLTVAILVGFHCLIQRYLCADTGSRVERERIDESNYRKCSYNKARVCNASTTVIGHSL